MNKEEFTHKDLSKNQLEALKETYVESRVSGMSVEDLKKFVKEVLDLQVKGTVGNEEEREVWKEMKEHFNENFENQVLEIVRTKEAGNPALSLEQEEFEKRLEVLKQRKAEEKSENEDMW